MIGELRPASTGKWRAALAASASVAAFAMASPALAQTVIADQSQTDDQDKAAVEQIPEKKASESKETKPGEDAVIVTGSRIKKSEFTSAAPIQILDPTTAQLKGTFDTAGLIQSSSVAAGSAQITSALSSAYVTAGGPGSETISLRGLGADRTLVLLNGRRAGPAGTRGGVSSFDLNVLPESIISSVQILKDGASSIYGSDAVAGVVNILTKTHTDGLELDATGVQPLKAGGEEYRTSATWGKEFDRGHILISGDYYKRLELERGDRKYLNCGEEYIFDPQTHKRADLVDPRTGNPRCSDLPWGHVWIYDYHYYYYGYGTSNPASNIPPLIDPSTGMPWNAGDRLFQVTLFQYSYPGDNLGNYVPALAPPRDAYDLTVPDGWYAVDYDPASAAVYNESSPFVPKVSVIPETTRYTAYFDGSYEITDGIEAYGEFLFNRRETYQDTWGQVWSFGYTSNFDGFGFGNEFSQATGPYVESPLAAADWFDTWQKVDYMRGVGGFRGEIEDGLLRGWDWDVYGQYSHNSGAYSSQQVFNDSIEYQYDIGFGAGPCEGKVTPISKKQCITINWWDPNFLRGDIPQAAQDYLFGVETGHTKYVQAYVEGSMTGNVFTLPAGDVGVAIGGTWRRDSIDDIPGDITYAVNPDYDPGAPVCQPGDPSYDPDDTTCDDHVNNAWLNTGSGHTKGASNTKEFFGEINIPVFKNAPFANYFELSGAARWTDVSTFGSDTTWKGSFNWQVNDWLRFRGTIGTSFRAPALFELFLANETSFLFQRNVDPCINWGSNLANGSISQRLADNCSADGVPSNHGGGGLAATIRTGGSNGKLDAETSKAKTISIVLTPQFLLPDSSKLNIAIDYFDIEVNGEISQLGAFNIIYGCLTSDFYPNDPLCDLYMRGQQSNPVNVAEVQDSFINVNSQKNRGVDLTTQFNQQLPGDWGDISLFSQMTWQMKDTISLFSTTPDNLNGEDGEPYWVGNVNLSWTKGPWTFFWGTDLIGRTSDRKDFLKTEGEDVCNVTDEIHNGAYCVDVVAEWRNYHNVSISRTFNEERYALTLGVSNVFDTAPPRVSVINRGVIDTIGQAPYTSQYDYIGRRIFVNLHATF